MLSGPSVQSIQYGTTTITWSGYNGDGTGFGNEYITISGTTDRSFLMKVYGYKAGTATVSYSWTGGGQTTTCPGGSGTFQQQINQAAVVTIGDIPSGLQDVYITLSSPKDVDVQLYDKASGTAIVAWPSGILNGAGQQSTTYKGTNIAWSGYNGDQVVGREGYEFIAIHGTLATTLTMKAYGYAAGYARVDYSWGQRFLIYAGIQGWDGTSSGATVDAADCSEIKKVVNSLTNNPSPDTLTGMRAIAATDAGGLYSIGYLIACGQLFSGHSRSALYSSGGRTLAKLDIQKYYNANKQPRVYLAGFSAGASDLQNLLFDLKGLGIQIQLSDHIDSVGILPDSEISNNVRRGMGFYQTEASNILTRGEDALWAEDVTKTFVTNTKVTSPSGPSTSQTAPSNYQHRNMDNDERTWGPMYSYINIHR